MLKQPNTAQLDNTRSYLGLVSNLPDITLTHSGNMSNELNALGNQPDASAPHLSLNLFTYPNGVSDQLDALNNQLDASASPHSLDLFGPSDHLTISPGPSDTTFEWHDPTQLGVGFNHPDIIPNSLDTLLPHSGHVSGWFNAPGDQQSNNDLAFQPSVSLLPVTAVTLQPESSPGPPPPIRDSTRPPPLQVGRPQSVAPSQLHSQGNTTSTFSSLPRGGVIPRATVVSPPNTLAGATSEPAWMEKKKTLQFFCDTFKLGCLPNVIDHWSIVAAQKI